MEIIKDLPEVFEEEFLPVSETVKGSGSAGSRGVLHLFPSGDRDGDGSCDGRLMLHIRRDDCGG